MKEIEHHSCQSASLDNRQSVVAMVDGIDVVECNTCGFKHILPLPAENSLKTFYEDEFYQEEKKDYFKDTEEDREWWMLTYNHYYELLEKHAPGKRLLEIGSGPGLFLECGNARGWKTLGFEPSSHAAAYATSNGCEVITDFFSAQKARAHGLFDVIALNFVLEHVPNPISFIREAQSLLAPGGVLFVVSPNDFNPLQEILWKQAGMSPWWVVPTHHLNYFSTASIEKLLTGCGMSIAVLEATYPMEFFLLSGRNYVGNPALGRACHTERKTLESSLFHHDKEVLKKMYQDWAKQGIGREFVVLAQN